jgi:hypothetical protein
MKQDFFLVNGTKYYTGTIFIINNMGRHSDATFICYDTEQSRYFYKVKDCICRADQKNFQRIFISVTDRVDETAHMPTTKTMKDTAIDGLFIGWLWYVFLMLISAIFKDAIGLWILISVTFFVWRKKKIEEEGTYIEW